jgi:exonuclease III
MYDSSVSTIGEYTILHSGAPSTTRTRAAHGVAILLGKQAYKAWKNCGSTWEAVSDRIITARLKCHPISITLIAVYSPTNPPPDQPMATDTADTFYIELQQTIEKTPKNDMVLIMGDFNARVSQQQHLDGSSVVGKHAVDDLNENGQRLTDLCSNNDLIIANTFFEHKQIHQMTWMHPGNKKWHMIDYTLVNRKFRSSVEDVRVYRMAAGSIGTDHHLVRTKIKFHLKSRIKIAQKQLPGRLSKMKLRDPASIQAFQMALSSTPQYNLATTTTNEKYVDLSSQLKNISETIFGDTGPPRKHKEWLTQEILDITGKKSHAFLEWQNHRGTRKEKKYRTQYCALRKLAKKKVKERQVEYWDELSLDIEQAIKQHDPATAYRMIRRLKGGKAKIEEMPVHDKQGKLLNNSHDRLRRWREHFSELLNVSTTTDSTTGQQIPITQLSPEEQSRQDKSPSLKEVEDAIRRMKGGKAPGIDGITADIIKAGGRALSTRLHTLLVEIWEEEENIDDWSTAIIIRLFKNKGDKRDCGNYRGISLLPIASKIFSRIILDRVQNHLGKQIMEQQAGFQPNKSTIDHILTLKLVMEKTRDNDKSLFLCFIDI